MKTSATVCYSRIVSMQLFCFLLIVGHSLKASVRLVSAGTLSPDQGDNSAASVTLRDVELFNLQSDKFIEALNEVKWTPFGAKKLVVPEKNINEIVKSTNGMRESVLAVKKSIEKEIKKYSEADIANKEVELQSLESIVKALDSFSAEINMMQEENIIKSKYNVTNIENAVLDFSNNNSDDSATFILGEPSIGPFNDIVFDDLPKLISPVDSFKIDSSFEPAFDLLESFEGLKIALVNATALPFWKLLGFSNIAELLGAPNVFNDALKTKSEIIKKFKPVTSNTGASSNLAKTSLSNVFPAAEALVNFFQAKDALAKSFLKPNVFNFLGVDGNKRFIVPVQKDLNFFRESSDPVKETFKDPFQDALMSLAGDLQAGVGANLLFDDLQNLLAAVTNINSNFILPNSTLTIVTGINTNSTVLAASPTIFNNFFPILGLPNDSSNASLINSLMTIRGTITQMFADFVNDIVSVQGALGMLNNDATTNSVPKDIQNMLEQVVIKGKMISGVMPFANKGLITSLSSGLLHQFPGFEIFKMGAFSGFKDLTLGANSRKLRAGRKLFIMPDSNVKPGNFFNLATVFEKLTDFNITAEQLFDATKLFESHTKFEQLLEKLSSIPFALTGSTPKHDDKYSNLFIDLESDETVFMNFINFVKRFSDPGALNQFMQKFHLLSAFSPNIAFGVFKNDSIALQAGNISGNFDIAADKQVSLQPFNLLFLPEIKQQFESSLSALVAPKETVTNDKLLTAVQSTENLINLFSGVKQVTPLFARQDDPVGAGLLSAKALLNLLSSVNVGTLPTGFASSIQSNMSVALSSMNPISLLTLPLQQLLVTANSFMHSLRSLKQGLVKNAVNLIFDVLKTVITGGLVFLSAIRVFITTFVFLLIQAPVSIKLFLWDLLMKSVELPVSIGISKEICANVQFGGLSASESMPAFEDASVRSKNFLSDVAGTFLVSGNSGSFLSDLMKKPFGLFNKSFNEKSIRDMINGTLLKGESVEVTGEMLKNLDETYNSVAKVEKMLAGDSVYTISGPAASSSLSNSKMFDMPNAARSISNGIQALLPMPSFASLPSLSMNPFNMGSLASIQQNLQNISGFHGLSNALPDSLRQTMPPLTSLASVSGAADLAAALGTVADLPRQALGVVPHAGGGEASSFISDTMDKLGVRNMLKGVH